MATQTCRTMHGGWMTALAEEETVVTIGMIFRFWHNSARQAAKIIAQKPLLK